jgi:hypothetical protein
MTILLLASLFLCDLLVILREPEVPATLLLAAIPLRADVIELLVKVPIAFEPSDAVDPSLVGVARRQGLDPQVEGRAVVSFFFWCVFFLFLGWGSS